MKRTIQSVMMLVALWGALLTIALRKGWEMPRWLTQSSAPVRVVPEPKQPPPLPGDAAVSAIVMRPRTATFTPKLGPAEPPPTEALPPSFARHHVCDDAAPSLDVLAFHAAAPLVSVACGGSLHLVSLRNAGGPERVARVTLPPSNPGERSLGVRPLMADLNADAQPDLLLAWTTGDAWAHARGRGLVALARGEDGGLGQAMRWFAASPLDVAAGALDGLPGDDLVVLQATDESVGKPREAWWVAGGKALRRVTTTKLAADTSAIRLVDLDRDQLLDLVSVAPTSGRITVTYGAPALATGPQVELQAAGCDTLSLVDFDGDARLDVLCTGDSAHVVAARADRELSVRTLDLAGERVRFIHTADVNADGKLDLVGYAHPQVVQLAQASADTLEPRMVAELRGPTFSVIAARIADLDGDQALDLLLLGRGADSPTSAEIAFVPNIARHAAFMIEAQTSELGDAPLLLTPVLR